MVSLDHMETKQPAQPISTQPLDRGAIRRRLWQLSYPTMLAMAMQSFYDLVDMAWVGQISDQALSGVTLFTTVYMLFTVLNEIAGASSVSMIAQAYGRGDKVRLQKTAEQTITFKVILALISALLLFLFIKPVLNIYIPKPSPVKDLALQYGYIRIFFLPLAFSSYSVNTIFRCTGDAKTPMKIMLVATVLNIVLDPILMFEKIPFIGLPGVGLGVFGAGLATVMATTLSFLYGFIVLLKRQPVPITLRGLLKLEKDVDRDLLMIGLPSGLQTFVRSFFSATMVKFVTFYGTDAIALSGLCGKLTMFGFMPLFGLSMAGSTMIGHALGRERVDEAELVSKMSQRINFILVACAVTPVLLFPRAVLSVFLKQADVIDQGVYMLWAVSFAMLISAITIGRKVVFQGSGYNRPMLYSTLFSRWFVQVPAAYIIARVLLLPLPYFWLSYVLADASEFFYILWAYRRTPWRQKRV